MKKYLFALLIVGFALCGATIYAFIQYFSGSIGIPLLDGEFYNDGTGNAGEVILSGSYIDEDVLGGDFWIQTVGTGTFDPGAHIEYTGTGNPTLDCWSVIGTAFSVNAGTIELSGTNTSLFFNPVSRKLEGYGWNIGIGRVPFGTGSCEMDIAEQSSFIGRVKVIGNMGGISIFSTFYDDYGTRFNANLFNTSLQQIRKNIGLLVRNISSDQMNTSFSTTNNVLDRLFYINTSATSRTKIYSSIDSVYKAPSIRSLIIVGGDLYIDENILNTTGVPKGIIVLKNDGGIGGNIYIHQDVKRIQSTIFAEGSIYSGEDQTTIYNDTSTELTALPPRQLYIEGAFLSRNTIGGASQSKTEAICPYSTTCTFSDATKYDLNYFRAYDSADATSNRAYMRNGVLDDSLDAYSVIIEYDSRIISNPPPGFE